MLNRRHVLASAGATLALAPLGARAQPSRAEQQLDKALADLFAQALAESPELSTSLGLDAGGKPPKFKLHDASIAELDRSRRETAANLARFRGMDRKALSGMAGVNYDCIVYELATTDRANKRFAYGEEGAGAAGGDDAPASFVRERAVLKIKEYKDRRARYPK